MTGEEARRTLLYGWGAYWSGRYDQLGHMLPTAIGQARAALHAAAADERADAADLAAQVLQLSACTLVQLGYTDMAHLALREALVHAEAGSDPLRAHAIRGSISWVLLVEGRFLESGRVAASSAGKLSPETAAPLPAWSLYGSLLLSGATAAGRAGDRPTALTLIEEAAVAALSVHATGRSATRSSTPNERTAARRGQRDPGRLPRQPAGRDSTDPRQARR